MKNNKYIFCLVFFFVCFFYQRFIVLASVPECKNNNEITLTKVNETYKCKVEKDVLCKTSDKEVVTFKKDFDENGNKVCTFIALKKGEVRAHVDSQNIFGKWTSDAVVFNIKVDVDEENPEVAEEQENNYNQSGEIVKKLSYEVSGDTVKMLDLITYAKNQISSNLSFPDDSRNNVGSKCALQNAPLLYQDRIYKNSSFDGSGKSMCTFFLHATASSEKYAISIDVNFTSPMAGNNQVGLGGSLDNNTWGGFSCAETDGKCCYVLGSVNDSNSLAHFLDEIFKLIKIAGPILVILMTIIDGVKSLTSSEKDNMSKLLKKTYKRLIFAVLLFLIPTLLDVIFKMFGIYGVCNIGL